MQAALGLLEGKGFSSLSLREVTREVGVVPTAFYRHFAGMEELGLALVDESFGTLREMLREARADTRRFEHVIRGSVEILVRHVHANRPQFLFLVRERFGGVASIRHAIRSEIRLFSSELATDLSRFPYLNAWSTEDLGVMASLIVNTMVSTVEGILEAPAASPEAEAEVIRTAERQLLMIALGATAYKGRPSPE
ncbi:MAG: TetR family transcriptional regulator [Actinomycetota bacterium]|nr:TetR family transcriptional regulator [Actinomycetota bacterium]